MKVFVTGGSGFVGSAVVQELLGAGHEVVGLARSDASAKSLANAGAEVLRGSLEDIGSLKKGAADADGVIHMAFIHDFSNYAASALTDKAAIESIGEALAGTNRPLIVTGNMAGLKRDYEIITEDVPASALMRASEVTALSLVSKGVRASVIRLPASVHDKDDHAFVPMLINLARDKGVSAYIGDGNNRWPAVHRLDAARLFRLVFEKGTAGSVYNATHDQGIAVREIANVIGKNLNVPVTSKSQGEEAADHFGWMSNFIVLDCPTSSQKTREQLDWHPTHIGLIEDMNMHYFETL